MLQDKQADHQLELSKMKLQGRALQNLVDFRTMCSVSALFSVPCLFSIHFSPAYGLWTLQTIPFPTDTGFTTGA